MRIDTKRSKRGGELATKSGRPSSYTPNRGDVVWLVFDPQAGHEQAGVRPAVVLSPKSYNERSGLILVVPVTRNIKGSSKLYCLLIFQLQVPCFRIRSRVLAGAQEMLDSSAGYPRRS